KDALQLGLDRGGQLLTESDGARETVGRWILEFDDAIGVGDKHRIRDRLQDGDERFIEPDKAFLDPLLIVDVGAGAKPFDDFPGLVTHGQSAAQVPTITSGAPVYETVLDLVRLARSDGGEPGIDAALHIVRVQNGLPAFVAVTLGKAGILIPTAVVVVEI